MQVRATLPDHVVRQRRVSRTKKPVGWVERQRNPSSFAETRAIIGRIARPIEWVDAETDHEEKAVAADKISPIVRHCASIAQLKVMGFATLNPSYELLRATASTPTPSSPPPRPSRRAGGSAISGWFDRTTICRMGRAQRNPSPF
jgi:hypothetical protein